MEKALGSEAAGGLRAEVLAVAVGETLEIGFGTGLNLRYYPRSISRLTAIDPEEMLPQLVERRITQAPFPVRRLKLDAQGRLPFDDESFNTVTTTFTLCSIPDTARTLSEMRRVLKSDGELVFLEHGRSDVSGVARWQDRLNPLQRMLGAGCNLNRRIDQIIASAGFEPVDLQRRLLPHAPRIIADLYLGRARKS